MQETLSETAENHTKNNTFMKIGSDVDEEFDLLLVWIKSKFDGTRTAKVFVSGGKRRKRNY